MDQIAKAIVKPLRRLADKVSLSADYDWSMPSDCPIKIPIDRIGSYAKNVYLKENLAPVLKRDTSLRDHYWIINKWGGIRGFKQNDRNNKLIHEFKSELVNGRLQKRTYDRISSLSKLSSFWYPQKYAICDSRAVFSAVR